MKVRLYRKIDRDLITLYRHPNFSLQKAILLSLEMAYSGTVRYIKLPEPYVLKDMPKKIELTIDIRDKNLLAWFQTIPAGTRNDTVKQLVRGFLAGPVISALVHDERYANIPALNQSKRQLISAPKHKSEIYQEFDEEYIKIKSMLDRTGQTPETVLAMLQKQLDETKQHDLDEKDRLSHPLSSGEEPTTLTVPYSPAPAFSDVSVREKPLEKEQEVSNPETEDDFDLMAAFQNLN